MYNRLPLIIYYKLIIANIAVGANQYKCSAVLVSRWL